MTAPCPAFGFRVTMQLSPALDAGSVKAFTKEWARFLASRGLYHVGAASEGRLTYIVASEASQAVENDRVASRDWLGSRRELGGWEVGELEDIERDT